jgi:hypothetical protein
MFSKAQVNKVHQSICGVLTERDILIPLYIFVKTLPINYAVASGNGNRFFRGKQ